jgi:SnoaL-like polyketide cyclase
MSTAKKEVMERWFHRVWTEEDTSAIEEMFIPDGEARGLGGNVLIGPRDFKQFHSALCGLLKDIDITIEKSIEQGDWFSCVCTLRARSQQSDDPIEITGSVFIRIVNGKLIEAYNHWDFLNMFGQLELLPRTTFDSALAGQKIA